MAKFVYTEEFAVRFDDIIKIVPRKQGGTYVYIDNHLGGIDRESTAKEYADFMKMCFKNIEPR